LVSLPYLPYDAPVPSNNKWSTSNVRNSRKARNQT
jgi:hypothetical protein